MQASPLTPAVWRNSIEIPASLVAQQTATLAPASGGVITAVQFRSGEAVTAGQLLVQLADAPQVAQVTLDRAKLAQAQRDLARTQKLMTISGASQAALEQAAALAAEDQAQLSLDEATLAQLQVTAPFSGVIGIRKFDPGNYLQAGQAVASLTAGFPLRVLFSIPQSEAGGLAVGDHFTLTIPQNAAPALTAGGAITALSPALDPATDARGVEGQITSPAPALLPGMSGVVDIATGAPTPALELPTTALNDSTLGPYVFVLTPAGGQTYRLSTVYVTILGHDGDNTLISPASLRAGEKIVAIGGFKLSDGASVTLQVR